MVSLYPHQQEAVEKLGSGKILWGGVGTGKSRTALAYYIAKHSSQNVIVITTAKKRDSLDWQGDAAIFGIGTSQDATTAGVLTVDSWNNLSKYEEIKNAFFIFDEQRLVGSGSWTKAFIKIAKQNTWILLSATPGDTWLDYIPVFIANGFYKNRTEFLREHVVFSRFSKFPKVDRFLQVGRLVRHRNNLLVEMPYVRHTTRETTQVTVEHDAEMLKEVLEKRWNVYEKRPLKSVAELFLVMRKVVNSNSTRLDQVRKLLEVHPRLIVFYNFNFELDALRSLINERGNEECLISLSNTPEKMTNESSASSSSTHNGSGLRLAEKTHALSEEAFRTRMVEPIPKPAGIRLLPTAVQHDTTTSSVVVVEPPFRVETPTTSTNTTSSTTTTTSGFQVAEWNGHKHQPIPETDRWVYLVQYSAGAEGWNCIETNAMCFYSLTYSYKNWHQAFGRIDRLNTPFTKLHYYVLMSNSLIDKAIWASLMGKKNFNENRFLSKILDTPSREKRDFG